MYAVIFRATAADLDAEYSASLERLKKRAFEEFNCLEFYSMMDGERRLAIAFWESESDARAWKADTDHSAVQRRARGRWYSDYRVQVCEVIRDYQMPPRS